MTLELQVLEPGPLLSVQDVRGRRRYGHLGVPVAGAADPFSAELANRLVGNDPDAALLELTFAGAALRFDAPAFVGLAGADLGAQLDGWPIDVPAARHVPAGATLRFVERRVGTRAYLAVAGGLRVATVLGSAATDIRGGFGGHAGRSLRAGDRIAVHPAAGDPVRLTAMLRRRAREQVVSERPVALVSGPHGRRFAPDAIDKLCGARWRIGHEADRAGVRLDGPAIEHEAGPELPSLGLPLGAVQVPPDGRPIIMLADRPVTGGYPVIGCVARCDIGRVAQLAPGDELAFTPVSAAQARDVMRALDALLAEVRPDTDPSLGWAGALD